MATEMVEFSIVFYPKLGLESPNGYVCYVGGGRTVCYADGGRRLQFSGEISPERLKTILFDRQEYDETVKRVGVDVSINFKN